jgi:transcriptional regulator with XRE-family HTH domain
METLGKKIRLLRHKKEWTQEIVARQLEISIPAYSKIETDITDINLSRLEQIARLFNTSSAKLLTANEEETQNMNAEMDRLHQNLHERDVTIFKLQNKIIELHEILNK